MNRREFLRPAQLASTWGQAVGVLDAVHDTTAEPVESEIALIRARRRAMATIFETAFPIGTADALFHAEASLDEIDLVEAQLTVYRDSSETSRINQRASHEAVSVDDELFRLLTLCRRLNADTDGAFDITAGPLIKAWGFFRRCHRFPDMGELTGAMSRIGMQHVALSERDRTIRFRKADIELNFGSIGKGYALDRVAKRLVNNGIDSALLHGGYSSVYAMGSPSGDSHGWPVTVRHPWDAERQLAALHLRDSGLATSAATYQNLTFHGRRFGHIIDPRTGWPAETMSSTTVIAPTAAEADALATAFFINGTEWARGYCESHPEIGAVLLPANAEFPVLVNLNCGEVELG